MIKSQYSLKFVIFPVIFIMEHTVHLNNPMAESNKVRTTKYTWLTFVPKCIIYQFARLANIYFLLTAILMLIPNISPLDPLTAIIPLALVIGVAMIKEGL